MIQVMAELGTWVRVWIAVLFVLCASLTTASAQVAVTSAETRSVSYDHAGGAYRYFTLKARDGQDIFITIVNTRLKEFQVEIDGLGVQPSPSVSSFAGGKLPETRAIQIKHSKKFSAYLVQLKRQTTDDIEVTVNNTIIKLQDAVFVVGVETQSWQVSFAGAFIASRLIDPVWKIHERPDRRANNSETCVLPCGDGTIKPFVEEDRSAEDKYRLAISAFAHIYHSRVPLFALTFGLGIGEANKTTYYAGPSLRFGDQGAFTVGVALGPISHLPAGATTGEVAADRNILNNLGSRIDGKLFFALSYSFIDTKDKLSDPFKPKP